MPSPRLASTSEMARLKSVRAGTLSLLCLTTFSAMGAEADVGVSSLGELCSAVVKSDQVITMKPGSYDLSDLEKRNRTILCSGSNNTIDLTGVYVNVPVGTTRGSYLIISGDKNTFKGGTFEDTYRSRLQEVTDFGAYNRDRSTLANGLGGDAVMYISGDHNQVLAGCRTFDFL